MLTETELTIVFPPVHRIHSVFPRSLDAAPHNLPKHRSIRGTSPSLSVKSPYPGRSFAGRIGVSSAFHPVVARRCPLSVSRSTSPPSLVTETWPLPVGVTGSAARGA